MYVFLLVVTNVLYHRRSTLTSPPNPRKNDNLRSISLTVILRQGNNTFFSSLSVSRVCACSLYDDDDSLAFLKIVYVIVYDDCLRFLYQRFFCNYKPSCGGRRLCCRHSFVVPLRSYFFFIDPQYSFCSVHNACSLLYLSLGVVVSFCRTHAYLSAVVGRLNHPPTR